MRLTPPERRSRTSNFPQTSAFRGGLATIALAALAVFASGLFDDAFVDEYAYITQSYYADLYYHGRWNDPGWIDDLGFDLQPVPKYLIGLGLKAAHIPLPGPWQALRWYGDAHTRYGPPLALTVARMPSIAIGVIGCLALCGCGVQVGGPAVGTIGALLLLANPLFRLHAHRAMSDVPCEAFLIAALGLAMRGYRDLWSGRRLVPGLLLLAAAGGCEGLSLACKLNGLLGLIVASAWAGIGLLVPGLPARSRLGMIAGASLMIAVGALTFAALNPALTARPRVRPDSPLAARAGLGPWGRFAGLVRYRLDSSAIQREMAKFSPDVVSTPGAKGGVFLVQGFGRFGPLGPSHSDSTVRYQWRQDWGALVWLPLVLFGAFEAARRGRVQWREGAVPSFFAPLIWALLSWAVVAAYLPLAWDRYLLPIQAPNAWLAALGMRRLWDLSRREAVDA